VLVGSGNPEEGELRPQLLDRYGLSVEIRTPQDLDQRIEIVRRRDQFERDPQAFLAAWEAQEATLRRQITSARARLARVAVGDEVLKWAARLCMLVGSDGLRGELTLMRAARAVAALHGKGQVSSAEMIQIAPPALRHRLRRDPMDEAGSGQRIERAIEELGAQLG
jgi:magnesium chelatase subunit I